MPAIAPGDGRAGEVLIFSAALSSRALILMPRRSALWIAAGPLWVLDARISISMEPFRAFVADLLPEFQRTRGFAMQSLFIGLGAVIASALPYLLTNVFHVAGTRVAGTIPFTVRLSFYIGAVAFLGAVLWTAPCREDTNGNEITSCTNNTTSEDDVYAYTDSLGRVVNPRVSTTDYSNCTGSVPISSALTIGFAAPSGARYGQVVLCRYLATDPFWLHWHKGIFWYCGRLAKCRAS